MLFNKISNTITILFRNFARTNEIMHLFTRLFTPLFHRLQLRKLNAIITRNRVFASKTRDSRQTFVRLDRTNKFLSGETRVFSSNVSRLHYLESRASVYIISLGISKIRVSLTQIELDS